MLMFRVSNNNEERNERIVTCTHEIVMDFVELPMKPVSCTFIGYDFVCLMLPF